MSSDITLLEDSILVITTVRQTVVDSIKGIIEVKSKIDEVGVNIAMLLFTLLEFILLCVMVVMFALVLRGLKIRPFMRIDDGKKPFIELVAT